MAVELRVRSTDGTGREDRHVNLASRIAWRRLRGKKPSLTAKEQEAAARQVARGLKPQAIATILSALAHPQRIQILLKLLGGEATHRLLAKATGLGAGPLYHHLRELRMARLIGPKTRDLYVLSPAGRRAILAAIAMARICR